MSLLKKGDKIGIIAPSVGLKDKDLTSSLNFFKKLGLTPVLARNIKSSYRYMAGTDEERAKAINELFEDNSIKALFCLRGGAGATRLLPYLNFSLIKKNPKPIVGLSDSTSLQNALLTKTGNPSLTGFLPLYDIKENKVNQTTEKSLISSLFDDNHQITSGKALLTGSAEGQIIGGCLSVLLYLCGTPYFPDLTDKILILEDIEEKTYKIDLMLNQLKQQKNFKKLKAVIFGAFTDCPIIDEEDGSIDDCIKDFAKNLEIPIITDFSYGHIPARYLIPLGIKVRLSASAKKCSLTW